MLGLKVAILTAAADADRCFPTPIDPRVDYEMKATLGYDEHLRFVLVLSIIFVVVVRMAIVRSMVVILTATGTAHRSSPQGFPLHHAL
jgi:hypothetical protein